MKRRDFLRNITGACGALVLPINLHASSKSRKDSLRFGICADVHKDIMHDADQRLETFLKEASHKDLDFIIQLGDFCRPYEHNLGFLNVWKKYQGEKYHVLGNHDMDGGFSREQVLKYWGVSEKYYSFNKKGVHFIVLDGNDKNPSPEKAPGYARFIGEEQKQWLKNDIKSTDLPCIIFSHQSLENAELGLENRLQIREILENENKASGTQKILACISGHHHTDYVTSINSIYYLQINSMSNSWLGGDYKTIRYSKEIDEKYPWIKYTVPYQDPLYAFVELDHQKLRIEGVKSKFVGPGPDEVGYPKPPANSPIVPKISNRKIRI